MESPNYPNVARSVKSRLGLARALSQAVSFVDRRWQARRGVFASPESARPGSAWWQAVNEALLCDAWEARHLFDAATGSPSRPAVARWLRFLEEPSPRAWYQAHNASVVAGYIQHRHLTEAEFPVERFFMDVALGRVLFVQALVGHPRLALGRWLWRSPVGPAIPGGLARTSTCRCATCCPTPIR
jgi:hypothetical protein